MKKFILFILIIIIIIIFFGCKKVEEMKITESKYFELPDRIIIYKNGVQSYIEKNTELYNKIVYLTDKRFERECGLSEEMITKEMINDIKNELAIEFIYSKEMQTTYKCFDYSWNKHYTKILFPLPDSRAIFGDEEKYQNCPWHITIHPEANYLISIIEEKIGD
jgi:hypothetical protein